MQKDFNSIKPYTYWIKNKLTGIKYFGVRSGNIAKKLTPNQDFGKVYFTSGSLKKDFKNNKHNYIIKLIRTFDTVQDASDFEKKINKKNALKKRYANKASWPLVVMTDEIKKRISKKLKGKSISSKTRNKISKKRKGMQFSEQHRKNLSKSHLGKLLGLKRSDEFKKKISETKKSKGFKHSASSREKMSQSRRGSKHSEETRKKIAAYWTKERKENLIKRVKKRIVSLETRKKMSESRKGKKHTEESKKKMSEIKKSKKI